MTKKQLIMEKALELFAENGFESTSIQQITNHCGISKGAFYLSFKSKDELILALIDHFMMRFYSDIDYAVKSTVKDADLLYNFYYATFDSFQKHSDFGKIFLKEQMLSFNEEFISKLRAYDQLTEKVISSMVERLYGNNIEQTKYDLIYSIKGFMKNYSELFLFFNVPLDIALLAKSLVEKTNILAQYTTIPFITTELIQQLEQIPYEEVTKEQILEILGQTIIDMEESIEKESLLLLKNHLIEPTLSPPLVKGLLENIHSHPHCKRMTYLLRGYFGF